MMTTTCVCRAALPMELYYAACALLLSSLFLWKLFMGKRLNPPPGPPALPLIGHLHMVRKPLHKWLLEQSRKYGPLMMLRLGLVKVVVASSPQVAEACFRTHDMAFSARPYMVLGKYLRYDGADITFSPYGEHWREMRKLCTTRLFTTKSIDSYAAIRREELSWLFSRLLDHSSKKEAFEVKKPVGEFNFNVSTRMLMSRKFFGPKASHQQAEVLKGIIQEMFDIARSFNISELAPQLQWLDWNIPRTKRLHKIQDGFFQAIIDEHRDEYKNGVNRPTDFIDLSISFFEHLDKEKQDTYTKAMLMDLTPNDLESIVVEWAMAELLHHPEIMARAQAELDAVVGPNRLVEEEDLLKLEYVRAIVKETFRLHPPAPLLAPRCSVEACNLMGYDIPKGATLMVSTYAIGRDPEVWDKPLQFAPERFVGKTIDVMGQDFGVLPFGSGRRSCPAAQLASRIVYFVFANMLHCFNWSLPDGVHRHPVDAEVFAFGAWMESPLVVQVSPRLEPQVLKGRIGNDSIRKH